MMNLDEIVSVILKVLTQQEELNSKLNTEEQQKASDGILVRLTKLEESISSIESSLKLMETSLQDKVSIPEKSLGDLEAFKDLASDILEIQKEDEKYGETVTVAKGVPCNIFGVKTVSKYNKAITRAMKSKHFTAANIIAEVKRKHASVSRFSGKELLYQVKKAKWRLDTARRKKEGIGYYANQVVDIQS